MLTVKTKLAFRRLDIINPSIISNLICLATRSSLYHVELILECSNNDKYWIGCNLDKGVYLNELRPIEEDSSWVYIDLDPIEIKDEDYSIVKQIIENEVGSKYDMLGALLGAVFKLKLHSKTRWFCSEIVSHILKLLGNDKISKNPNLLSPIEVYKLFNNK